MPSSGIQRREGNVGPAFVYHHQASGIHLLHLLAELRALLLTTESRHPASFFTRPAHALDRPTHRRGADSDSMALLPQPTLLLQTSVIMGPQLRHQFGLQRSQLAFAAAREWLSASLFLFLAAV